MSKKFFWFYLEPYVHISTTKRGDVLLYNSLNGKILEYKNQPGILKLCRRLKSSRNLYVVRLGETELENPVIKKFINTARRFFMGDLLDTAWSDKKPFQMMPLFNLQKDVEYLEKGQLDSFTNDIMTYLNEITIFVNNRCALDCSPCNTAYRQFTFCTKKNAAKKELEFALIEKIFAEAAGSSLSGCSIAGGNVFKYSRLENLIELLNRLNIETKFYINYRQFGVDGETANVKLLENTGIKLNISIHPPYDKHALGSVLEMLKETDIHATYEIIAAEENDLNLAYDLVTGFGISSYLLRPYYTGKNAAFFKKAVFLRKRDISEARPGQKEIFARMSINTNDFGKITLLTDGSVYANINRKKMGNLYEDSLPGIIQKEMVGGKSWRALRRKVKPCRDCLYHALCPPLSNYEYVTGRNNLCHIYDGG